MGDAEPDRLPEQLARLIVRCASCGYVHVGQCPLCACGAMPDLHVPVMTPASPLRAASYRQTHPCPDGRRNKTTRERLTLRRASFKAPEPAPELVDWFGLLVAAKPVELEDSAEPGPLTPPVVPARPPHAPGETAPRAVRLGKLAVGMGWQRPRLEYWRAADDGEGCGLKLARGELRAVATWKRDPGQRDKTTGWSADIAYAWRNGNMPVPVTHTVLERLLNDTPDIPAVGPAA